MSLPPLSRMGFGTGPFGKLPAQAHDTCAAAVDAALAAGIRHFDAAPFYGLGQAERWLGDALRGKPRDSFVVSTKVGRSPVDADGHQRAEYDFSRDSVLRSIEESLARLQLDAVDILLIHDPDDHWQQALDETYPALAELRAQGVVKAIGAGMNQWQMLARFVEETDIDVVLLAGRYTLLDQSGGLGLLPLCLARGVGVLAAGIFNSGVLATDEPAGTFNYEPAPPEVLEQAERIAAICAVHGVTLPHAAVAFVARHPAVTELLIGVETPDEVRRNLALLDRPVPEALWTDLGLDLAA